MDVLFADLTDELFIRRYSPINHIVLAKTIEFSFCYFVKIEVVNINIE